jgi:alpha-galactosidase
MRRLATFTILGGALVSSAAAFRSASTLDNGLARTPPMGWNSWNKFGCNVSDKLNSRSRRRDQRERHA